MYSFISMLKAYDIIILTEVDKSHKKFLILFQFSSGSLGSIGSTLGKTMISNVFWHENGGMHWIRDFSHFCVKLMAKNVMLEFPPTQCQAMSAV